MRPLAKCSEQDLDIRECNDRRKDSLEPYHAQRDFMFFQTNLSAIGPSGKAHVAQLRNVSGLDKCLMRIFRV
jgi:hypothetical protein